MVNLFMLVSTVMFSVLWNFRCASSQSSEQLSSSRRSIHIPWSAGVSAIYPPSNPLRVKLGDILNITCPANGTSNIWIQWHLEQYEQCNCSVAATAVNSNQCDPTTTVRHVCQDEVILEITHNSENLNSALSFQQNTTFYLISYSRGETNLAGYAKWASGGQCTQGFKMAVTVSPTSSSGGPPNVNNTIPTVKNKTVDTGGLEPEGQGDISGALPLVHLSMGLLSILYFLSSMVVT